VKHALLALCLSVLPACTVEDFVDTARTDTYHLTDKGVPDDRFELYDVASGSGTLKVVHTTHPDSQGATIFFCHGASANLETSWARVIVWYELGFDSVVLDYRGFGASSGSSFSEASLYADAEAALVHAIDVRGVDPGRVILYGHSLGGPVAAELALRHSPAALVLESTFTSLADQIQSNTYFETPDSFFTELELDTARKVRRMGPFPKLILHGQKDPTWPVWNAHELFAASSEPKRLFLCAGCGHRNVPFHDAEWYRSALCDPSGPEPLTHCLAGPDGR
jgi:pimeloyl-ACP methyl ester carboxylesterase